MISRLSGRQKSVIVSFVVADLVCSALLIWAAVTYSPDLMTFILGKVYG